MLLMKLHTQKMTCIQLMGQSSVTQESANEPMAAGKAIEMLEIFQNIMENQIRIVFILLNIFARQISDLSALISPFVDFTSVFPSISWYPNSNLTIQQKMALLF